MIRMILRYNMIHTIHTLYRTIHKHLRYADAIQNVLQMIRYVSYDTYRISYDTDNYEYRCIHLNKKLKYINIISVSFLQLHAYMTSMGTPGKKSIYEIYSYKLQTL